LGRERLIAGVPQDWGILVCGFRVVNIDCNQLIKKALPRQHGFRRWTHQNNPAIHNHFGLGAGLANPVLGVGWVGLPRHRYSCSSLALNGDRPTRVLAPGAEVSCRKFLRNLGHPSFAAGFTERSIPDIIGKAWKLANPHYFHRSSAAASFLGMRG
jgi:hypothetical protein